MTTKKNPPATAPPDPPDEDFEVPPGVDPMGSLDGDPILLMDAARLPRDTRRRVVAYSPDGTQVRPWAVTSDMSDPLNGVEKQPDGSIKVWW